MVFDHCSKFDPFLKVRTQRCAARGQSIVVISPLGNVTVLDPNDRNTLHGDF